jgi:ankyrin repeat protein
MKCSELNSINRFFGKIKVLILISPMLFACFYILFLVTIHAFNDVALRYSAAGGEESDVKLLLYLGANVHASRDQALQLAALNGHREIVKTLLDHGADIHVNNDFVLFQAIKDGHADIVKLLLDRGNFAPSKRACERSGYGQRKQMVNRKSSI